VRADAANPTRPERFPRGEAIHFREHTLALGVPHATNTGLNITLSRAVLDAAGIRPRTVMLIAMPYMQRRGLATCRKVWRDGLGYSCAA
jgi:uncharacterized SAM-binding protein YcdF (DUF218 family)